MGPKQRDPQRDLLWRETIDAWQANGPKRAAVLLPARSGRAVVLLLATRTPAPRGAARVGIASVPAGDGRAGRNRRGPLPVGHVVMSPTADAGTLRVLFAALAAEAPFGALGIAVTCRFFE